MKARKSDIVVYWKSTGTECTRFRHAGSLATWLATAEYGVTDESKRHPSVDLRDVIIPREARDEAAEIAWAREELARLRADR